MGVKFSELPILPSDEVTASDYIAILDESDGILKRTTPEIPVPVTKGGTGNQEGYVRAGRLTGSRIGTKSTAEGYATTSSEEASHAEGTGTSALNKAAHAEGTSTTAAGEASHAEGSSTTARGDYSHAEGINTLAKGTASHASGNQTIAGYDYQTVIGKYNNNQSSTLFEIGNGTSNSQRSNAFEVQSDGTANFTGNVNITQNLNVAGTQITSVEANPSGYASTSLEKLKVGTTVYSIEAGLPEIPLSAPNGGTGNTTGRVQVGQKPWETLGENATSEGYNTIAYGAYSHAEGYETQAKAYNCSHAEGYQTVAEGSYSHAEGKQSKTGYNAEGGHAEGIGCTASGSGGSHAEGSECVASGTYSHAEGSYSKAIGQCSHAEGYSEAQGNYSHSEGEGCIAYNKNSHAEGRSCSASGDYSHAEGYYTSADGTASHTEGYETRAGDYAHSGGHSSSASGDYSFAHGYKAEAVSDYSHAEGEDVKVSGDHSFAHGQYINIPNTYSLSFVMGAGGSSSQKLEAKRGGSFILGDLTTNKFTDGSSSFIASGSCLGTSFKNVNCSVNGHYDARYGFSGTACSPTFSANSGGVLNGYVYLDNLEQGGVYLAFTSCYNTRTTSSEGGTKGASVYLLLPGLEAGDGLKVQIYRDSDNTELMYDNNTGTVTFWPGVDMASVIHSQICLVRLS